MEFYSLQTAAEKIRGLECEEHKVIEFGSYLMKPDGTFGSNSHTFDFSEEGFRIVVEKSKIPYAYMKKLPPRLQADNLNHGLSEHGIRANYDIVLQGNTIESIIPRGFPVLFNQDILELASSLPNVAMFDWHLALDETYLYFVLLDDSDTLFGLTIWNTVTEPIYPTIFHTLYYPTRDFVMVLPSFGNWTESGIPLEQLDIFDRLQDSRRDTIESFEACKKGVIDNPYDLLNIVDPGKRVKVELMKWAERTGMLQTWFDLINFVSASGADNARSKLKHRRIAGDMFILGEELWMTS